VALLAALVVWGTRGVSDAADQLRGIALVVVIALPLLVAAAVLAVPEGRREGFRHQRLGFIAGLRLVAANPAFRRMIGCVVFFVSGIAVQGTLHRLVLGRGSSVAPHLAQNREAPRTRGGRALARPLEPAAGLSPRG
jgi:hypothetical protein